MIWTQQLLSTIVYPNTRPEFRQNKSVHVCNWLFILASKVLPFKSSEYSMPPDLPRRLAPLALAILQPQIWPHIKMLSLSTETLVFLHVFFHFLSFSFVFFSFFLCCLNSC